MDCCICSPMVALYKPPRNSICLSCYEGAKSMMAFLSKAEKEEEGEALPSSSGSQPKPPKDLSSAFKRVKEMKRVEEDLKERLAFLGSVTAAYDEGIHTDILIRAGDGPPIPAHRALLASKSEIFRTLFSSDECKAPANDTISLPELAHAELRCLLHFLYSGSLPDDIADEHTFALLLSADKYNIPFLRRFCERRLLGSLGPATALDVLEVSEACSSTVLKESAMNSISAHVDDIVFSSRFDEFGLNNASLCVEITRMLVRGMKNK